MSAKEGPGRAPARLQLRQPRVAEMVANVLRSRILSGELDDGDLLPKQDELFDEFQVSKPSVREAFRILETEGLVTVRRGNVGGAVVHIPDTESVAYMLALVLEVRGTALSDLGTALRELEPAAAALCASRSDRMTTVVPRLREAHELLARAIDTGEELASIESSRQFHETLVDHCGNETLRVVVGTLETLWSTHEHAWAQDAFNAGTFPTRELRQQSWREHDEIIRLIEAGDAGGVAATCRHHLESAQQYPLGTDDPPLQARRIRNNGM